MACAYAAVGDNDAAFRWLDRGFEVHSAIATMALWWPGYRPLRDDPRFRDVLRRVHLELPPSR